MNHTGFITTERAHLVNIAEGLAAALPVAWICERFPDPRNPLTIAVNGTQKDGKKIIPDLAIDLLLGRHALIDGRYDWDEIRKGHVDEHIFQASFINVAWNATGFSNLALNVLGYSDSELNRSHTNRSLLQCFNRRRSHPGISFVHNANNSIRRAAAIEIWIESKFNPIVKSRSDFMFAGPRMLSQAPPLRDHFTEATCTNGWVRWCEIRVNDRRLFQQTAMQDFMRSLHLPNSIATLNNGWRGIFKLQKRKGIIPQYGINLPRPQV